MENGTNETIIRYLIPKEMLEMVIKNHNSFTIAKNRKQLKYPLTDEGTNTVWCTHKVEYYLTIDRMKFWHTLYITDEPWKHWAKWNKPDQKRTNITWFYLHEISNRQIYRDRKYIRAYQGLVGERNGELLLNSYRVCVLRWWKSFGINSGSWTSLWM